MWNTTAIIPTDRFVEDPHGVYVNAGDVGGDYQAGDSQMRSFASKNQDGTYTLLDFYVYLSLDDDSDVEWEDFDVNKYPHGVTIQANYTVCRDPNEPGDTAIASDSRYWNHQEDRVEGDEKDPVKVVAVLTVEDLNEAVNQMAT